MESRDGSADRKPRSVKQVYAELKDVLSSLSEDRQKTAKGVLKMGSLVLDLKQAITDSGLTHYAIGKAAGVQPNIIDRFTRGERDLRFVTASKIAETLGYGLAKLEPRDKLTKKKKPKTN